jgi:hypothetical protein
MNHLLKGSKMKTIMAIFLLLVSTSLLADRRDCTFGDPGSCRNERSTTRGNITAVPEPGSLALIGLGVAGLVVARRRKK